MMTIPDPASYADRFSELVEQWKQRTPQKMVDIQNALRHSQRERAWKESVHLYSYMTELLEEQAQLNAMVVAALDALKQGQDAPSPSKQRNRRA